MISRFFPFLLWFSDYNRKVLRADLVAGLTVALVLIPQSMAYAQLAGLPPYYGLYAALLPPMVAALFGSSRQLATGPVAVVSLMTAAALEPIATAGSASFIAYAVMLAMVVGIFQLLLGVLRLGLVVNFLSHPVVNGFINAAAIIIATSQLAKIFGVEVDKAARHYETVLRVLSAAWHYTHWPTLAMALLAMTLMAGLKKINPKIPNVLVAVGIATVLSWSLGFEQNRPVDLSAVASDEVRALVGEFNHAHEEEIRVSGLRTDLSAKPGPVGAADEFAEQAAVLARQHEQALLGLQIEAARLKVHEIRRRLRDLHFVAVERPQGGLAFVLREELPAGTATVGAVWRLKVGIGPLDEGRLSFTGGGAVVGNIPRGLPSLQLPGLDVQVFLKMLPYAVIISLLGFMEAISIAKAMAARTGHKLDPNQELIGQGLANIIGSLASSYPVSGSFSRSAVNLQAGGATGLSNVFSSLVVVVTLLFLTPLLYHLPQAVLAAVIMMAVIGLVNTQGFVHAWKAQKYDGFISVITFGCTLIFAPHLEKGIFIGVVLSVAVFLYRRMRPKVATLSMSSEGVLQCAANNQLQLCRHIAAVRFDGSLFFANASYLDEQIFKVRSATPELQHILLVADGINDMDASGEAVLSLLKDRLLTAGVGLSMCKVKENVLEVMKRSGLLTKIGVENIYASNAAALSRIIAQTHEGLTGKACGNCPLMIHVPVVAGGTIKSNKIRKDHQIIEGHP